MNRRQILKSSCALAIAVPMSGCATLVNLLRGVMKDPQISLRKMTVKSATLERVHTIFDVDIKNPNPIGFRLDGLGYALALEGARFARGDLDESLALKANGTSRLALPVEFSLGKSAEAILGLLGKEEVAYALDTTFKFRWKQGKLDVPVTFDGKMPLPKVPEVEVRDFRFTSIGLSGLGVRVLTTVKNPNPYDIPIDRFRFDVTLNGNRVLRNEEVTGMRLRPRQTRDVRLEFTIGLLEAGLTALSLAQKPQLRWEVGAELKSGTFELPFEANGNVRLA